MKKIKRYAVLMTVVLFVCAAVYLNWSYSQKENATVPGGLPTTENMPLGGDESSSSTAERAEYFASVRLSRQQARDEASQTLQTVSSSDVTDQETIDAAAEQMMKIADWTVKESEIESMIKAKGFEDCVVFITDEGVTVTVASPEGGLSSPMAAQITDIIKTETGYTADSLKIIEI